MAASPRPPRMPSRAVGTRSRRLLRRAALAWGGTWAMVATLVLAPALPAAATGPPVTGAGSTWAQVALDQWRADYARLGYQIEYSGVGSSAGRNFYIINE